MFNFSREDTGAVAKWWRNVDKLILISAIILFFLGSGPVRGFAVTLGIGILTTLFSAYFFARHLTSIYVMKNKDGKISL